MTKEEYKQHLRRPGYEIQEDCAIMDTPYYGRWVQQINKVPTGDGSESYGLTTVSMEYPNGRNPNTLEERE